MEKQNGIRSRHAALAAFALASHAPRVGAGIQADASRSRSWCTPGRAAAATCWRAPSRSMMEKEKLLPVRMQVVNKPGGNGAVGRGLPGREEGRPAHDRLLHRRLAHQPAHQRGGQGHAEGPDADRAPGARAGGDRGARPTRRTRRCKDFIDGGQEEPRAAQAVGRLGHAAATTSCGSCCRRRPARNWAFISFPGGGERIAALLGGHVNMMVIEPQEAGEHIRAGNMRVLAQVTDKRLPGFPDVPTLKEAGFDMPSVPQVRGVVAPPAIPTENVAYWEDVFRKLTKTESWQQVPRRQPVRGRLPERRASSPSSTTSSPTACAASCRRPESRRCADLGLARLHAGGEAHRAE